MTSHAASASHVAFACESIESAWDEGIPLTHANQLETGAFDPEDFNPSREVFQVMEDAGYLAVYVMRDSAGKMVGYGIFGFAAHPFYPSRKMASTYVFYVVPEHRGRAAVRFMYWTDEQLRARGIYAVGRQVRSSLDYSRTLLRMGYTETERSFMKRM